MTVIIAWSSAWAKVPERTNFNVEEVLMETSHPGKFAISFKDYQDIRIDSDLDGKVDLWRIKTKNLEVTIRYKESKPMSVHLKKIISRDLYREVALLKNKSGHFSVIKSITRPAYVLNGSADEHCLPTKNDKVLDTVTKTAEGVKDAVIQKNIYSYIDESCMDIPDGFQTVLLNAMLETVSKDTSPNEHSFSQCINSEKTISAFKEKSKDFKVSLDLASASFSQNIKKIEGAPSKEGSFKIECKEDSSANKFTATYKEESNISISIPKNWNTCSDNEKKSNSCGNPKDNLVILLRHELLHKSGLKDENVSDRIANFCSGRTKVTDQTTGSNGYGALPSGNDVSNSQNSVAKNLAASTIDATPLSSHITGIDASILDSAINNSEVSTTQASAKPSSTSKSRAPASDNGGGSDGVDMKAEIAKAESVIPSAEKLAQTKVDKSPEGIQAAVKESVAESTPVLRMANQVMGAANTPAVASSTYVAEVPKADTSAAPSYESSSSSGGSNSTDSGSGRRYQSKNGRYQSSSETVVSSNGPKVVTTSRNGLAAGERVVEEVDLTTGTNFKAANTAPARGQGGTPREAPANRTTAASKVPTAAVPAAPSSLGGEVASPGAINLGSNGSSSTSLGGDIQGKTNSPAAAPPANNRRVSGNRAPASTNNTQSNTTSSREEIVSFLSSGSYNVTRNKLRDTNFVNTLKSNKVTIIDLYGNSFGAPKGEVIFLDEGNKFVRQK